MTDCKDGCTDVTHKAYNQECLRLANKLLEFFNTEKPRAEVAADALFAALMRICKSNGIGAEDLYRRFIYHMHREGGIAAIAVETEDEDGEPSMTN